MSQNKNTDNGLTGEKLVNAIVSFFVLVLVYFPFIMPWTLWKKSTLNIAKLHENGSILKTIKENDFPFFTWFQFAMDGLVFFSYIAAPFIIVIWSVNHELYGFIYSTLTFYFMPVMLTIIKELYGWFAYQANRTKEISDNTKTN